MSRKARIRGEEAAKRKAMRILRFGEYIASVPSMNVTRHSDYQLEDSTAYHISTERAIMPEMAWFEDRRILMGQKLEGVMIPLPCECPGIGPKKGVKEEKEEETLTEGEEGTLNEAEEEEGEKPLTVEDRISILQQLLVRDEGTDFTKDYETSLPSVSSSSDNESDAAEEECDSPQGECIEIIQGSARPLHDWNLLSSPCRIEAGEKKGQMTNHATVDDRQEDSQQSCVYILHPKTSRGNVSSPSSPYEVERIDNSRDDIESYSEEGTEVVA